MRLTLSMLAWPDGTKPDMRELDSELAIGRGRECGWVLADPTSQLSRRHCLLSPAGEVWRVTDLSLNGTFLNDAAAPIGRDRGVDLHDGDRIRLGAYVMEAHYQAPPALDAAEPAMPARGAGYGHAADNPFHDAPAGAWHGDWGGGSPARGPSSAFGPVRPTSADRFPDNFRDNFPGPPSADHSPAVSDAWHAPPQGRVVLPEDWDLETPLAPAMPAAPLPAVALPEDWDAELHDDPAVAPVSVPAAPGTAPPTIPVPIPPLAPAPPALDLLAAFLRGAGMPDLAVADPVALMEGLGAALRLVVDRLRAVQMSRAAIKREFRILGTMVRPGDNNPLKFSVSTDAALQDLLAGRRPLDVPIGEVLDGIRVHELAMIAAMREAVRELLETLSPDHVRGMGEERGLGAVLSLQRKARAFEQYETLHARTVQALTDDFDSVFGKTFARVYERVALADDAEGERRT